MADTAAVLLTLKYLNNCKKYQSIHLQQNVILAGVRLSSEAIMLLVDNLYTTLKDKNKHSQSQLVHYSPLNDTPLCVWLVSMSLG